MFDVFLGLLDLWGVGADTDKIHPITGSQFQILMSRDARDKEHSPLGTFERARCGPHVFFVSDCCHPLASIGRIQPYPVPHLDEIKAGVLQSRSNDGSVFGRKLEVYCIATISKGTFNNLDVIDAHQLASL